MSENRLTVTAYAQLVDRSLSHMGSIEDVVAAAVRDPARRASPPYTLREYIEGDDTKDYLDVKRFGWLEFNRTSLFVTDIYGRRHKSRVFCMERPGETLW